MISETEEQSSELSKTKWKVGRNIKKYGLVGLDEELVQRWTGEDREQYSLRELAEFFNKQLLQAVLDDAGMTVHERELDYQYKILTDKSVTSGMRTEAIRTLENEGIDYEKVQQDFVTHQAIYTYLSNYHETQYKSETSNQLEKDLNTINQLRSRTAAVIESTIERLNNTDRISIGNEDIIIDIKIVCHDCGRAYGINDLLIDGNCACDN